MVLARAKLELVSKEPNQCKKSKDFRDTKTKAHKIIFVCFQFCVLFGSGLSGLRNQG
jgi:hypothetical protein